MTEDTMSQPNNASPTSRLTDSHEIHGQDDRPDYDCWRRVNFHDTFRDRAAA
jgi:hypothetical protein